MIPRGHHVSIARAWPHRGTSSEPTTASNRLMREHPRCAALRKRAAAATSAGCGAYAACGRGRLVSGVRRFGAGLEERRARQRRVNERRTRAGPVRVRAWRRRPSGQSRVLHARAVSKPQPEALTYDIIRESGRPRRLLTTALCNELCRQCVGRQQRQPRPAPTPGPTIQNVNQQGQRTIRSVAHRP